MNSATQASHRRIAMGLLIAAALHVGVLAGLNRLSLRRAEPAPTIQLMLIGYSTPPRHQDASRAAAAGPAPPMPTKPVAEPIPAAVEPPALARTQAETPAAQEQAPVIAPTDSPIIGRSALELARAVASDTWRPAPFAAEPRTLRLADGASASPDFAYYLRSWRRKVERIGRLNYPQQAKRQGIVGGLRLLVVIAADGALENVRVLESSGHPLLDEAALRIVRLAAPYAPFSPAMRDAADRLEIERTWQFRNSRVSS